MFILSRLLFLIPAKRNLSRDTCQFGTLYTPYGFGNSLFVRCRPPQTKFFMWYSMELISASSGKYTFLAATKEALVSAGSSPAKTNP